jgi:arylsulfatase A-like enzyme
VPGGETHVPMHAMDWMPTLCALTGAKPAGKLKWDGTDIWPVLSQREKSPTARTLYCAGVGFREQMVRHGDWKLIVTGGADQRKGKQSKGKETAPKSPAPAEQLFNLAADPGETKNLAAEKPDVLAEMKRRLAAVAARDRDALAK